MVKTEKWRVLPHAQIEKYNDELWAVEGELPNMTLKRRMTLFRLRNGELVIHNGIALNQSSMKEIEDWGKPTYLVVPNAFHRLDAPLFKTRYPELKVLCADSSGTKKKVTEVVPVDGHYNQIPSDMGLGVISLRGCKGGESVFVHTHSSGQVSLVFTDALFNQPHLPGYSGLLLKLIGSTGEAKVTNIAKLFLVKNKSDLADHFRELATIEGLRRIIVSHGSTIETNAAATLRHVADRLVS